jgi:imidazolonepropionase-like amidohydrolase
VRLHLENARLIDGTGAAPVDNASLVIERDTIVHAGRLAKGDEPTGDARVMDLGGKTVIPGLIEAHLHLSYNNVKAIADLDLNCPPEYSTLVSAKNAELALRCGYTAARSAGSVHAVDVALKRAINEGRGRP